ncbi:MAG: hypothetical protein ACOYVD_02750 [Bacillota bacterium]
MLEIANLGGYQISFSDVVNNGDDTQSWFYTLKTIRQEADEISIMAIQLSFNPKHEVLHANSPRGEAKIGSGSPCLPFAANAVKWEDLNNTNVNGTYMFTLSKCYLKAEIQVAIKVGNKCYKDFIIGPSTILQPKIDKQEIEIKQAVEESVAVEESAVRQEDIEPAEKQELTVRQEETIIGSRGVSIF